MHHSPPAHSDLRETVKDGETDNFLIKKFNTGDESAFNNLHKRHKDLVYGLMYGWLKNREDAEDLSQVVWRNVSRYLGGFKGESEFTTWLHAICRNSAINFIKKQKRRHRDLHFSIDDNGDFIGEGLLPAELIDNSHPGKPSDLNTIVVKVRATVKKLSKNHQAVLLLVEQGYTREEMSDILGVKVGTVRSRLCYARKRLSKLLDPEYK